MRNITAAVFGLLCLAAPAQAGGWVSGGGSAVVCRDGSNVIVRAELLDLFEGRERFGMTIPETANDPDAILSAALTKLAASSGLEAFISQSVADVKGRRVFLPKHLGLHTSTDLGRDHAVYILDGCHLEQVGYFEADGRLLIATNVFDHLSPTGQAAFLLHETLYRLTRSLAGAEDSASARKLVAEMLSTSISTPKLIADVERAFNSATQENQFVALAFRAGAKVSVHFDPSCRPTPQPVKFIDADGTIIETLYFSSDSTQDLAGDQRIAAITTTCGIGFHTFEIFYDGKAVYQAFNYQGSAQTSLFISWR